MPRDEGHTRDALKELFEAFWTATVSGNQAYFDKYPDTAHVHRSTTRSSIIRDHIVDCLRASLIERDGIRIDDINQTTYFRIFGEYCLRVKKADELGLVQLGKTQASFEFQCNAQVQLHFDGDIVPEITNLYLSYVPNDEDPLSPGVHLICPREDGWHWRLEIEPPPAAAAAAEISGGPVGPPPNNDDDDLIRIPGDRKPGDPE